MVPLSVPRQNPKAPVRLGIHHEAFTSPSSQGDASFRSCVPPAEKSPRAFYRMKDPVSSSMDTKKVAEVAHDFLFGCTPNSPLTGTRPSFLISCYDKSSSPGSSHVDNEGSPRRRPITGQKYAVVNPHIIGRADASIQSEVIACFTEGELLKIIRYELVGRCIRALVMSEDEDICWCSVVTEGGEELLKLVNEDV